MVGLRRRRRRRAPPVSCHRPVPGVGLDARTLGFAQSLSRSGSRTLSRSAVSARAGDRVAWLGGLVGGVGGPVGPPISTDPVISRVPPAGFGRRRSTRRRPITSTSTSSEPSKRWDGDVGVPVSRFVPQRHRDPSPTPSPEGHHRWGTDMANPVRYPAHQARGVESKRCSSGMAASSPGADVEQEVPAMEVMMSAMSSSSSSIRNAAPGPTSVVAEALVHAPDLHGVRRTSSNTVSGSGRRRTAASAK